MSRKIVVTCALTGSAAPREKNSAVPVTPEEIATSALDAANAGAAIVHIHVRDPATGAPSMKHELYEEVVERIRVKNRDLVLNLTTGPGARFIPDTENPKIGGPGTTMATPAVRVAHIEKIRPPICTLDVATMNFGPHGFINTPGHLAEMARRIREAGVKPELEVFDLGHIELAKKMIRDGLIDAPPMFQLCLGISYAAPATPEAMILMRNSLPPGANWSAFGIGRTQFPMVAQTVIAGGHVRVGLEDNLYLSKGEPAPSNAALVAKAVTIIELLGESIASPAEAPDIFGVTGT